MVLERKHADYSDSNYDLKGIHRTQKSRGRGLQLSHYGRDCAPANFLSINEGIFH